MREKHRNSPMPKPRSTGHKLARDSPTQVILAQEDSLASVWNSSDQNSKRNSRHSFKPLGSLSTFLLQKNSSSLYLYQSSSTMLLCFVHLIDQDLVIHSTNSFSAFFFFYHEQADSIGRSIWDLVNYTQALGDNRFQRLEDLQHKELLFQSTQPIICDLEILQNIYSLSIGNPHPWLFMVVVFTFFRIQEV